MTAVPWWISRTDGVRAPPGQGSSAAQREANARRAVGHVRRFVRANGLEYLWTATYRDAPADRKAVVADLRRFFERLQAKYGRLPVVAVIERGSRSGRLHVHFAIDRWLPHAVMADLWGHGFVWVGDPGKLKGRTGARSLAGYLAKYVSKDLVDVNADGELDERAGAHRYSVTQGWSPAQVAYRAWDLPRALHILTVIYGVADQVCAFDVASIPGLHGYWLSYPDDVTARARSWLTSSSGADPPV